MRHLVLAAFTLSCSSVVQSEDASDGDAMAVEALRGVVQLAV